MLELTPQQQACSDAIVDWKQNHSDFKQVFRVEGPAGSGKTHATKYTIDRLGCSVVCAAHTGKAASVMASRGYKDPRTIHSLIYKPSGSGSNRQQEAEDIQHDIDDEMDLLLISEGMTQEQAEEQEKIKKLKARLSLVTALANSPIFRLNPDSAVRDVDLVVIDECSMVGEDLGKDLLSFGTPVLVMGDPGQLPPVFGEGFFSHGEPDFMLTEIHRQAQGSPVIHLATKARTGGRLEYGDYGESGVFNKVPDGLPLKADQIIVGRNATRRLTNDKMRMLLGYVPSAEVKTCRSILPQPGEKVICLRNNAKLGVLNGTLWKVINCHASQSRRVTLSIEPEDGGMPITVLAHEHYFTSHKNDPKLIAQEIGFEMSEAESFDYGYCVTAHKAQGSQWDNVLVIDQSACFGKDCNKWLYTAITRAIKNVWVVRQ